MSEITAIENFSANKAVDKAKSAAEQRRVFFNSFFIKNPCHRDLCFAISDFMAMGVAKAVTDSGLTVGKDISIVGFDGMDVSCYYNPGITTVKQPREEIAIKSVEILFDLLKDKCENQHILLV